MGSLYQSVKVSEKKKRDAKENEKNTHTHTLLLVAMGALHAWYMWSKLQTLMCTHCLLDTCGPNLEMVCFVLETNGPNLKEVRVLLACLLA